MKKKIPRALNISTNNEKSKKKFPQFIDGNKLSPIIKKKNNLKNPELIAATNSRYDYIY